MNFADFYTVSWTTGFCQVSLFSQVTCPEEFHWTWQVGICWSEMMLHSSQQSSISWGKVNFYSHYGNQCGAQKGGTFSPSRYNCITLVYIPKESFILSQRHLLNEVHYCLFYNSHRFETTYMLFNWRIYKGNVVNLTME